MSVENLDKFWESEGLDSTTLLTGRSGGRNLLTPSAGGISLYGDSLTGGAGGGGLVSTLSARAVTSYAASAAGTQTNGTAPALFSVASAQAAMVPPSAAASVAVTSSGSVSSGVTDGAGSVSDASATGGLSADSYDTDGSNDSRDTATVLTDPAGTLNSLSIHSSTDRDFYKLVLENDATGKNFVDIAFAAGQGNLDLHLINSSGTVAVKTGTATDSGKRIDLNGLAAGTYYIRVQSVSGSQNTYSLSWDGTNYGLALDAYDADTPNDSRDTATVLPDPAGTLNSLSIHNSANRDFYKLVLENDATGKNFVDIAFAAGQGDLALHLINSSGSTVVKTGTATDGGKRIDLSGLAAGTYYIRVQSVSGSQNTYSLSWGSNNYGLAADAYDSDGSNDSRATATVLSDPAGTWDGLSIHSSSDRDFYKLVLESEATGENFVNIAFAAGQGDLALHLVNSSGSAVVKTGTATEEGKRIDLNGLAAGTYYIRVQSVSGSQNSYSLSWGNTSHTGGGEETAPDLDPTGMNADVYDTDGSNDSRSTATILPEQTGMLSDLTIHSSTDRDFYKLVLENDATGKNFVNIAFAAGQGDLALDMVNSNGSAVVKTGTATEDGKRIDLNGLAAGTYYIRVQGVSGSQNTYSLSWDGNNYGLAADACDTAASNDSRSTATVLSDPAGTLNDLTIHSRADRDFYKLVLENDATGKNFVDIAFAADQGNLDLHLINSSGTAVKTGTATENGKRIDLNGLAAGTYYIRVQGVSGSQNTYSLSWDGNNYGLAADACDTAASNDSRSTATVLSDPAGTLNDLTIHSRADRDFYKLVLENDATGKNFVDIAFAADQGNLDLHLINSSGTAVKMGTATDGGKRIDLNGLAAGTYYIRVQGVSGSQNTYSLSWDGKNYGLAADVYDTGGSNDTRATATVLPDLTGTLNDLSIHSRTDNDYFAFTLDNDGTAKNVASIVFDASQGDLNLHLINSSGTSVRTGTSTENGKAIDLSGLDAGTYYIRVQGASGAQNTYSLVWDGNNYGPKADVYDTDTSNDTRTTATVLPDLTGTLNDLSIHSSTDKDFFAFTLANDGTEKNIISIAFDASMGDLNLQLLNSSGTSVKTGTLTESGRQIVLEGLAAGTYYIRVQGVSKSKNAYALTWDGGNYGYAMDAYDTNASNDSTAEAVTLEQEAGSLADLTIHNGTDKDFFALTLINDATAQNFVSIAFDASAGDLNLNLLNASGTSVKTGVVTADGKRIDLTGLAPGTYYIRVQGVSKAMNTYTLSWDGANYGLPTDVYDTGASNEKVADAVDLGTSAGSQTDLSIHSSVDKDFFVFELANTGTVRNYIKIDFDAEQGNLSLVLMKKNGTTVKTATVSDSGREMFLSDLAAGTYYIRVMGSSKATNTYTLSWDGNDYTLPADVYDTDTSNNDARSKAVALESPVDAISGLTIHSSTDVDFYSIELTDTGAEQNFVKITLDPALGELELDLINSSGTVVKSGVATDDGMRIDLLGLAAGTYYIRVRGVSKSQNTYTLSWDRREPRHTPDAYDTSGDNDSITAATPLPEDAGSLTPLTIHTAEDVDYFRLDVPAGGGTAKNYALIEFDSAVGDLSFSLVNAQGVEVLSAEMLKTGKRLDLSSLAGGTYYLRIAAGDGSPNLYTLSWDKTDYTLSKDMHDRSGGNDSINNAVRLGSGGTQTDLTIHDRSDIDYFRLDLSATGTDRNYVKMLFDASLGDLELELYAADGTRLSGSRAISGGRQIDLAGLASGTYYIKISGIHHAVSQYSLTWDGETYQSPDITAPIAPVPDVYDTGTDNNARSKAVKLSSFSNSLLSLSIHDTADVDFFKIVLDNTGTEENYARIFFDALKGDLEMSLISSTGTLLIDGATTISGGKELSLAGLKAGAYYIKITGGNGATNTYSLAWDRDDHYLGPDKYDASDTPNDSTLTATTLAKNSTLKGMNIHSASDVDYYTFTLAADGVVHNAIRLLYDDSLSDLDIRVYDALNNEVGTLRDVVDGTEISLNGLAAGTYYVRIMGENGSTGYYDLEWNFAKSLSMTPDPYDYSGNNDSMEKAVTSFIQGRHYATASGSTSIEPQDVDYFKFTMIGICNFGNYISVNNISGRGEIDLELLDAEGNVIRTSYAHSSTSRRINMEGIGEGTYYVRIFGDTDAAYGTYSINYDLTITFPKYYKWRQPDPWTPDNYEGNGDMLSATNLFVSSGNSAYKLSIHSPDDVDYFRLTLTGTGSVENYVRMTYTEARGELLMELYDSAGRRIVSGMPGTDMQEIYLNGLVAGTYYVKVQGVGGEHNIYTLEWNCADASINVPTTADAARLTSASGTQSLTRQQEARYYTFDLSSQGMAGNYISVTTDEALRLSLFNAAGEEIYSTISRTRLNLSGLDAGSYYLKVEALDFAAGDSVSYTLSHDLAAYSSSSDVVCGKDNSSLFAIKGSTTEYAYLMGYGNVTWDDFIDGKKPYSINSAYIDAEKSAGNSRDDLLCWAGTSSNMLTWSGWGEIVLPEATGDNAEDVIFSRFSKSFPDTGGMMECGISWFFRNKYVYYANTPVASSGTGNYIGVSPYPGITQTTLNGGEAMASLAAALEQNMAVGLTLGYYNSLGSSSLISSHAVTVWGYTYDITKEKGSAEYYTGLLITDSDDNDNVSQATDAPDTLHLLSLKWSSSVNRYYSSSYYGALSKMEYFVTLAPVEDWPGEMPATLAENSAAPVGNDLDSLMNAAMQPNAGSLLASAELTPSSDSDTRKQQATLVA